MQAETKFGFVLWLKVVNRIIIVIMVISNLYFAAGVCPVGQVQSV